MAAGRRSTKDDAPENPEEFPTSVYVVTRDGRTKIGIARNVARRVRQLSNNGVDYNYRPGRQRGICL